MSQEHNNLPTPNQIEEAMIGKELSAQKAEQDPLDTHAQLFFFFNPRFQATVNMMDKKPLLRLMATLAGSEHNSREDINKLSMLGRTINKKGIARVIKAVIEHPLQDHEINLLNKSEGKLFQLLDSLLINKYYTCIQKGMEKKEENQEAVREIEDVIFHSHNLKEFEKRAIIEKDAFAVGNKLLASKFLMMLTTHLRELKRMEDEKLKNDSKPEEVVSESK